MIINSGILRPISTMRNIMRSIHPFLYPASNPSVTPIITIEIKVKIVMNNVDRAPTMTLVNKSRP